MEAQKLALSVLLDKVHPQQNLLTPEDFAAAARKRGLNVSSRALEDFERLGLLFPLLRCDVPFDFYRVAHRDERSYQLDREPLAREPEAGEDVAKVYRTFFFSPDLLAEIKEGFNVRWPGQGEFTPWSAYKDGWVPVVWTYYHPYQIFRLSQIATASSHNVQIAAPPSDEQWEQIRSGFRLMHEVQRPRLDATHAQSLRLLALLMAAEDIYLPQIRDFVTNFGLQTNPQETWDKWQRRVDRQKVLADAGYSVDEVANMRKRLARYGLSIDPNENFYMLLRSLDHRERGRLKGQALLAWDFYEAAEILGYLLEDLTGEKQPNVDDLWGGGQWKERLYGIAADKVDYRTRNILPHLLRHFGIDVRPRVLWIVEGDTEKAFVDAYCDAVRLDLGRRHVLFECIHGINKPKDPVLLNYLKKARDDETPLLVTVDNEKGSDELVSTLRSLRLGDNLLTVADLDDPNHAIWGILRWPTNFEDANFATGQLFEAWLATVPGQAGQSGAPLHTDKLRQRFADFAANYCGASSLKMVQEFANLVRARYDKPAVGSAAAELIVGGRPDDPDLPLLPIEKVIAKVIRLADSLRTGRFRYDTD